MKLKKIWTHKWRILEGLWYNHVVFRVYPHHWAYKQVKNRREICSNCPFFDPYGMSEVAILKGFPACGVCGCNIQELTASLLSDCSLLEEGKLPKWKRIYADFEMQDYVDKKS